MTLISRIVKLNRIQDISQRKPKMQKMNIARSNPTSNVWTFDICNQSTNNA